MRHGEVMGIITDQALHALLPQQLEEQVFAFVPASPRGEPQCSQEQVSQHRFPRVIFGSRHRQHRITPPSNHPCLTTRLIPEITNPHRFAGARLCHNDMPAPLVPRLMQKALKPALKGSLAVMWTLSAEMCPTSTSLMWTNCQFVHINSFFAYFFYDDRRVIPQLRTAFSAFHTHSIPC
jgi:hypothetical protein